jgi:homoserine kinase type II
MTHGSLPDEDSQLRCPYCTLIIERVAVTMAGELIGCESCALERGLSPVVLSLEEWHARDATREALSQFNLHDPRVGKPPQDENGEPRAHVWWVWANERWYFLKRYHAWLSLDDVTYEHSVLRFLADRGQPVATPVTSESGASVVRNQGALWGLYPTLPGQPVSTRDWMWRAPKAAECLALLHTALEQCAPEGTVHPEWDAWTPARLDGLLEEWPYVSEVGDGLVEAVRDHLMRQFFGSGHSDLPTVVIHGDFSPSNVLWRGDQVTGIVDFEQAHRDTVLMDFAAGLGSRHPPLLRAVVATYTRVRPLSDMERHHLPEAMLLGGLVGLHAQMAIKGDFDEASRRGAELEYLLRDVEIVRRAVATR